MSAQDRVAWQDRVVKKAINQLKEERDKAIAQRDALLAACEALCCAIEHVGYSDKMEAISWDEDDAEEKTWRFYVPKCELEAYDITQAAIDKAKGDD